MIIRRSEDIILAPALSWFKSFLNTKTLSFGAPERLASGEYRFKLTGEGATQAEARERYPVHFLVQRKGDLFWFGVACTFERIIGESHLKAVSLLIFAGEANDEKKTPLLRAEWDFALETDHGQPHCHVYQFNADNGVGALELLSSEYEKFHFAMGMRWLDTPSSAHSPDLISPDSLRKWLSECVGYIRQEVSYV